MPVQIVDFWKLLVTSGALSLDRCKQLHATFQKQRSGNGAATANDLAKWLVAEDIITRYQAIVFLSGRPGPFVFGDYRVFDRIETGRLAGLLRAVHMKAGHRVLLHLFKGRAAQDPAQWQELLGLGRAAASAQSEHLSEVQDMVEAASQKIAVLADLDGQAVAEKYTSARLAAADAMRIVRQAAEGLAALHASGIVHGAVYPANLWLETTGNIRLLQFPLSSESRSAAGQGAGGAYAAPELATPGRAPDVQSDIYSLGRVLVELLTGKARAAGAATTVQALEKECAVSRPVAETIARMIDADPRRRFATAAEVAAALGAPGAANAKPRPLQPILVDAAPEHTPEATDADDGPFAFKLGDLKAAPVRKKSWRDNRMALSTLGAAVIIIGALLYFVLRPGKSESESAPGGVTTVSTSDPPSAVETKTPEAPNGNEEQPVATDGDNTETVAVKTPTRKKSVPPTIDRRKPAKVAVDLVDDDGASLWASPTDGAPIGLQYLPSGSELYLVLRPAEILAQAEGKRVLDALGPGGAWGKAQLEAISGLSLTEMSQLIVAFNPKDHTVAMVLRSTDELDPKTLREKWGNPNVVDAGGKKYFSNSDWAYYLPDDDSHVLAITSPAKMTEAIGGKPSELDVGDADEAAVASDQGPPLSRQLEKLLKTTDRNRHVTLLAEPHALLMSGESVLAGNLLRLHDSLVWFFGDDAAAVSLSFHMGDDFFAELKAVNKADMDPYRLNEHFKGRIAALPEKVEEYKFTLNPQPYGRRILDRLPQMIRLVEEYARIDAENQQAVVRCYLPAIAAHNLAMGVELALAERPGASVAAGTPAVKKPASAAEALKQQMSLTFGKESLEKTVELISKEIDTEIILVGKDMELDGITRNQSINNLNERNKTAGEILRNVMKLANPDGKLVYVIKPKGPGGKEAIFVTTRAAAAKRGEKLPAELEAEPGPKK